ncbi:acyltransferase [Acinetobacter indicus]|uniref:acyltransferase n=1 Tax=Acinetobacter indicus TaxID=756892 RepID=UPI0013630DD2|nr:acyltransferase [Acinetobacter indicus]
MSGRDIFKKYSKLLNAFYFFYNLFPDFLSYILLNIFNFGKVGFLLRYFELKKSSEFVGENVYIAKKCVFKNLKYFSCGINLSIHEFCYIDAAGGIEIGDNVSIAHNCSLVSFEHTWENLEIPIKYNPTKLNSIKIGNDVWLGCGVRVLAGTVIEDRVIVAAGAVVKGTLESGYLYGGIPAKKLKKL